MPTVLNVFISLANVLMILTSLFLICLVLIQRGKGGGLAGAFGGVGGSSAFGTKAGDVFTRVTIYVALLWFSLAIFLVWSSNSSPTSAFSSAGAAESAAESRSSADKDSDLPSVVPSKRPAPTNDDLPAAQPADPGKAGASETTNKPAAPAKTP
jgi:preprotein translocase subunit SecG